MKNILAWTLLALGIGHIGYGFAKFKTPLLDAIAAGFIGQFRSPDIRGTAIWFILFGVLLMLAGQVAIYANSSNDLVLLKIVGIYVLVTAAIGAAAFPISPFLIALPVAMLVVACGYGLTS